MNATTTQEALQLVEAAPAPNRPPALQQTGAVAAQQTPRDLLALAVHQGAAVETLERLWALHVQFEDREAKKACVESMAAFKAEPITIFKRKQVGYETRDGDWVGYSHAELSDVTDAVVPAMAKHGLSHRWDVVQQNGRIVVTCIVTHKAGHSMQVTMDAAPDNSGKKNAIQQTASTVTYLQRYTLLAVTGMSTSGMDDDGNSAGNGEGAGNPPAPPPPPAAPESYSAEQFTKNLPDWTAWIEDGRRTPDALIKVVETKGKPMTEEQKAQLRRITKKA
jgi:hypothetical protein